MSIQQKLKSLEGLVSGDIFKDYVWKGPFVNAGVYQRVTDPKATNEGAFRFLPNPKNKITVDDLEHAEKAEMIIEMWGGHAGTTGKSVRINGNEWLSVPESEYVGNSKHENYYQFRYPRVALPLEYLSEGENTLEFTCSGQLPEYANNWPQWGVYSVVLRVYYSQEKAHTSGKLKKLNTDSVITNGHTFEIDTGKDLAQVQRVDYIGFYEDFDYNGNGIYNEWQCSYKYGELKNHIGSSVSAPFSVKWDSEWVPDQENAIKVAAIITNNDGIRYVTSPLNDIRLVRDKHRVVMYKSYSVPPKYGVNNKNSLLTRIDINDDLTKAAEARLTVVTWNGDGAASFELNKNVLTNNLGKNHDYGIDELPVSLEYITKGTNYVIVRAVPYEENEHGVEIAWPGAVIKVMYNKE